MMADEVSAAVILPNGSGRWSPEASARARAAERRARHWSGSWIERLYRYRRLRNFCLWSCRRFEGDPMFSATLRQLLDTVHGVAIGRYSYGAILRPGVLPRGSRVGAYCSVGTQLIVRRRDHPVEGSALHPFFYNSHLGLLSEDVIAAVTDNPLEICNDVWIGDRVTILGGCRRIGNGAVIGAGAVVTRDVEPYSVVAGVPARPIRIRLAPDRIAALEASRWWERSISEVIGDPALTSLLMGDVEEKSPNPSQPDPARYRA